MLTILYPTVCVGGDDGDGMDGADDVARDAAFQQDPEHFDFSCLSSEETWNYLDSQAREASREIKVSHPPIQHETVDCIADIFLLCLANCRRS